MLKNIFILLIGIMLIFTIIGCGDGGSGGDPTEYNVILTPGTGYTLTAKAGSSSPVTEGGSFTFVFALEPEYDQSPFTVKVNGAPVSLTAGEYTITNITSAKTVTVEGVIANAPAGSYNVIITQGTGYTLTAKAGSSSPVTEGGSFTFVFALLANYNQSTPTVKVNGTAVSLVAGEYTIINITSAKTVTVEGVVENAADHTHTYSGGYKCTECGDADYRLMGLSVFFDAILDNTGNFIISGTSNYKQDNEEPYASTIIFEVNGSISSYKEDGIFLEYRKMTSASSCNIYYYDSDEDNWISDVDDDALNTFLNGNFSNIGKMFEVLQNETITGNSNTYTWNGKEELFVWSMAVDWYGSGYVEFCEIVFGENSITVNAKHTGITKYQENAEAYDWEDNLVLVITFGDSSISIPDGL